MHTDTHLQIDFNLDVTSCSHSPYCWRIRIPAGGTRITWKDPTNESVCGRPAKKFARRGELNKITCSYCKKYYLKFVGTK